MRLRHAFGVLAVLGATVTLAAGASRASAADSYRSEPVTLQLPWYWAAATPPRPAVFLAYSPSSASFTYVCPAAETKRFLPVFRRSASSIRFH